MTRDANYTYMPLMALPAVAQFSNVNLAGSDPVLTNLRCYAYYQIGRFLYFRFDDQHWITKQALGPYNRQWVRPQLGIHDAHPVKLIIFQLRDNTMLNLMTGLAEVVTCDLMVLSQERITVRNTCDETDNKLLHEIMHEQKSPTLHERIPQFVWLPHDFHVVQVMYQMQPNNVQV